MLGLVGSPLAERVREAPPGSWDASLDGFRYRFFSGAQVAGLLDGLGEALRRFGSLEAAYREGVSREGSVGSPTAEATRWLALATFAQRLSLPGRDLGILLPVADSKGAFKRLNLFFRWMVRHDAIDPGGWSVLTPADLFMPVDTHVLQWARREGLTRRNLADARACREITAALRGLEPEDPLRWDFAITRQGMDDKNTLAHF